MSRSTIVPTDLDVLCGRGRLCFEHEGNRTFRELIAKNLDKYVNSTYRKDKSALVRFIAETVVNRGGRFLVQSNFHGHQEWIDGGEKRAREKVGHTFRDALTAKGKCIVGLQKKMQHAEQQQKGVKASSKQKKLTKRTAPVALKRKFRRVTTAAAATKQKDDESQQRRPATTTVQTVASSTATNGAVKETPRVDTSGVKRKRVSSPNAINPQGAPCRVWVDPAEKTSTPCPPIGSTTRSVQQRDISPLKTTSMRFDDASLKDFCHDWDNASAVESITQEGDDDSSFGPFSCNDVLSEARSLFLQTTTTTSTTTTMETIDLNLLPSELVANRSDNNNNNTKPFRDILSGIACDSSTTTSASGSEEDWASDEWSLSESDGDLSVCEWSEPDMDESDGTTASAEEEEEEEEDLLDYDNFDW